MRHPKESEKSQAKSLSKLPELPVELLELGSGLDFSTTAPIITNRPLEVRVARPQVSKREIKKSNVTILTRAGWALYPRVVCHSLPDRVVTMTAKLEPQLSDPQVVKPDLASVAKVRRNYKLSGFKGITSAYCEVRYGPWYIAVLEIESCYLNEPSDWVVQSQDPPIHLEWSGTWGDRPVVPNLTLILDLSLPAQIGMKYCL